MPTIYSLETDGLVWYIGSTTDVIKRKNNHKTRKDKYISSDLIPQEYEFQFKILEECGSEIRYERERYYYELLKPLNNINIPGRSKRECMINYYQDNKEQILQYKSDYYENNKERILQYRLNRLNEKRDYINQKQRENYAKRKALKK